MPDDGESDDEDEGCAADEAAAPRALHACGFNRKRGMPVAVT